MNKFLNSIIMHGNAHCENCMAVGAVIAATAVVASAAVTAATAAVTGKKQAEALESQADKQLQANREQIAAQKEENEKAYQRNSSLAQKAQLMQAGLSEQQALQVIAGNGSTGEYVPADIRSTMEGVDYAAPAIAEQQAIMNAVQPFAGAIDSIGSMLGNSYGAEDGGQLGHMISAPFNDVFAEHIDMIDQKKVHNFIDFKKWVKSLDPESEQGKIFKPMLDSKAFKDVERSALGIKSFNSFVGKIYTANLDSNQMFLQRVAEIRLKNSTVDVNTTVQALNSAHEQQLKDLILLQGSQRAELMQRMQTEVAQYNLLNEQVLGEEWNNKLKALDYKREDALFDVITEATKASALESAAEAMRNFYLYDDEDYIEKWVQSQYATTEGQLLLAQLQAVENADVYSKYERDPVARWITQLHALFKGAVTSGVSAAGAATGGLGILMKVLKKVPK